MKNNNLIFIHGFTSNKDSNNSLKQFCIDNDINFYAINLPGHGDNDFNNIDLNIESFGEYIKKYIDDLNLSNFILYGHSLGGAIAVYLTSQYQNRFKIKQLILEDPLNPGIEFSKDDLKFESIISIIEKIKNNKSNHPKNGIYELMLKIDQRVPKNKRINFIKLLINIISRKSLEKLENYFSNINVETFIAFGENDYIISLNKSISFLKSLEKDIEIKTIKDAGHSPYKENVIEYNKWLETILNKK